MSFCGFTDCERPIHCKGLCKLHYERQRRGIRIDLPAPVAPWRLLSAEERFALQIGPTTPTGCIEWAGSRYKGYGRFKIDGRLVQAHRFSYELHVGPIPDGLEIDHLCRNRACVNPAHLEAVTHAVNTLRSDNLAGLNARKTHCPAGHEYAGANLYINHRGSRECRTCIRTRKSSVETVTS